MYTAIVLNEESRNKLKSLLLGKMDTETFRFKTQRGDVLPHHMTVCMGSYDTKLNHPEGLGEFCELIVDGFVYDLNVIAARVIRAVYCFGEVRSTNSQMHITMALKGDTKPFASNALDWSDETKFHSIDPTIFFGIMQECH